MKSNTSTATDYSLSPDEFAAVRGMIAFQGRLGPGVAPAGLPDRDNYFVQAEVFADQTAGLKNAKLKTLVAGFFTLMLKDTAAPADEFGPEKLGKYVFSRMMLVNRYRYMCAMGATPGNFDWYYTDEWKNFYHAFLNGWHWESLEGYEKGTVGRMFFYPGNAPWKTQMQELWTEWNATRPSYLPLGENREKGGDYFTPVNQMMDRWHPKLEGIAKSTHPFWDNVTDLAKEMIRIANLPASDYILFLHLLIALPTGNEASRTLGAKLLAQKEMNYDDNEEPFINHLLFAVLMILSNPKGDFKWNNGQLNDFLEQTKNAITYSGATADVFKNAIGSYQNKLRTDAGYPHSARPDASARLADTLSALNVMRSSCV